MKIRGMALTLLLLCLLGGLVSSFFTPAIAATLTLPTTPGARSTPVQVHARTTPTPHQVPTEPTNQPTPLPNGVMLLTHDTFQRPDQSFWGTASDGRVWESDAQTDPAFAIVNHAGQISGNANRALQATINVPSPNAEILLSGTVNQFDANGDINLGGVLRWTDANNWYKVLINGSRLQLLKEFNGNKAVLADQPFQATAGTEYSIRFRVLGSSLFAKAWPSAQTEPANWTILVTDTVLTSGVGGVRVLVAPGAVIRVTSFLETTVSNTL